MRTLRHRLRRLRYVTVQDDCANAAVAVRIAPLAKKVNFTHP
jgi:hypothetical protein